MMKNLKTKTIIIFLCIYTGPITSSAYATATDWNQRQLAAMKTVELSIHKLENFLKTHPGDYREPEFLIRLADLYLEQSGITFEYTEGDSMRNKQNQYRSVLKKSTEVMARFINHFPKNPSVPDMLYKQGKAFRELGQVESAKKHFQSLVESYPNHSRCDSALMELAKFAQDENKHELALKHLQKVIAFDQSIYHAIAYHHSAWSRFNLGEYQEALEDLAKEMALYGNNLTDNAFLDVAVQDYALFYFEAINKKAPFASTKDALKKFNSIVKEKQWTEMVLRFSKLLKAYRFNSELEHILDELDDFENRDILKKEVALLLLDLKLEQHDYVGLDQILKHIKHDENSEKTVFKLLAELQQQIVKNKKSTQLERLLVPMNDLTGFLGSKQAFFSSAETAFQSGRYSLASSYYQKIPDSKDKSVRIRLIASIYQELLELKTPETTFKAVKMNDPMEQTTEKNQALMSRWVALLNDVEATSEKDEVRFLLESLKYQYRYLDRNAAVIRMLRLSFSKTPSNENEISASIILDTLNASGRQDELAKHCENGYWESFESIKTPCLLIRAQKLVVQEKYEDAGKLVEKIKTGAKDENTLRTALLLNSTIHLKQGKISRYIEDLEMMLNQGTPLESDSAKEILQYHWFHRNKEKISHYLHLQGFCDKIPGQLCDQYEASLVLMEKNPKSNYLHRFRMSTKGAKNSQAIWGLSALEEPQKIPFQDRVVLVQRIANHWDQIDPFLQVQFVPLLKTRMNETLEGIRVLTPKIAPMRADESSIERRIQLILELDQTFSKAAKLNWMSIRFKTLQELARIYDDLGIELKKLATPEKYITPFLKKKEELIAAFKHLEEENSSLLVLANDIDRSFNDSHLMIPENYRNEWITAVKNHHPDYLQYLISLRKNDSDSEYLRGLVLCTQLRDAANAEGLELIRNSGRKN